MDNRPIGIFDSGLGGLTSAIAVRKYLPGEDIIYFGDSKRAPYGGRPISELLAFAFQNIEFLRGFDVKLILAACGTVSSSVFSTVEKECSIPMFGVIEPAALAAARATKNGRIGVIATEVTVSSGAYQKALLEIDSGFQVFGQACPRFVPLVEAGCHDERHDEVKFAIREYLSGIRDQGVDTLLLGCTHYPLLGGAVSRFMGNGVNLISSGEQAAAALRDYLKGTGLCACREKSGKSEYYTSGDGAAFQKTARLLLGEALDGPVIPAKPYL